MKVVIAPDTFKESLPAPEVAAAMAAGIVDAVPHAVVDLCPMADGGEGIVAAMVAATNGRFAYADVYGPLGAQVRARYGLLGTRPAAALPGEVGMLGAIGEVASTYDADPCDCDACTAVIEMAAASGLHLVPENLRDPLRSTTFGTGQLILAALDAGAREIILGIGGSATVDGGAGCGQALGVLFRDAAGQGLICGLGGGGLGAVEHIDLSDIDPRLAQTRIRIACDVTNPLLGDGGAARVYGPQKGADSETVERLEANLAHFADVIRRELGVDVSDLSGSGAAGGLGAGLVAFAGATLERGVSVVADAVSLRRRLHGADLCLTGEGRLDAQTASGKTAAGVAGVARQLGVPVICIPGAVTDDAPRDLFAAVHPLVADGVTPRAALANAAPLIRQRTAAALREFLRGT